jgi:hypothetical protein
MKIETQHHLETQGWYYKRLWFSRGRPGTLILHDGRLAFFTAPSGSAMSIWYENDSGSEETVFDVSVEDIEAVSYNWLVGALTLVVGTQRHIVSFAGPPSGSHSKDAGSLLIALTTLKRWRAMFQNAGPATPNSSTIRQQAQADEGTAS